MRPFLWFAGTAMGSFAFQISVAIWPDKFKSYGWAVKWLWLGWALCLFLWLISHEKVLGRRIRSWWNKHHATQPTSLRSHSPIVQSVPGPELNVAYDTGGGNMLNWPLAIQSISGGTAYRVRLEGLRYGTFAANLRQIDAVREGTTEYFSSPDSTNVYAYLLAAIAGTKNLVIPVTVECEDASNNKILHFFEFDYKEKAIPKFRLIRRKLT